MNWRYLLVVGTASILIPIGGAIAVSQKDHSNPTPTQSSQCAPPPPPMMGRPPEESHSAPPWAKDLNLSNEQQERIQTVHEQTLKETEELQQQLMAADQKMRSLLDSDASSDELHKQHQEVQTLRQQLDEQHFEGMLAEHQVLTKEQRTQMSKLMQRGRPPQPPQ